LSLQTYRHFQALNTHPSDSKAHKPNVNTAIYGVQTCHDDQIHFHVFHVLNYVWKAHSKNITSTAWHFVPKCIYDIVTQDWMCWEFAKNLQDPIHPPFQVIFFPSCKPPIKSRDTISSRDILSENLGIDMRIQGTFCYLLQTKLEKNKHNRDSFPGIERWKKKFIIAIASFGMSIWSFNPNSASDDKSAA
jgi:hypothetical protein